MPENYHKFRLKIFLSFMFIWVGLIFVKLVYVQLVRCEHYREKAVEQQEKMLDLAPRRGIIYDRNGVKLAVSVETDSLCVDPQMIKDPADTLARFAKVLDIDCYDLSKRFNNKKLNKKRFLFIKRKLTPQEKKAVLKLDLKGLRFCEGHDRTYCEKQDHLIKHFYEAGIYFKKEYKRYYPNGSLASHLIGISNIDEEGTEGLELHYDDLLKENPCSIQVFKDAKGNMFPIERSSVRKKESHLVLTIDAFIQHFAERELHRAFRTFKAYKGCAIVMDIKTGEILALAIQPSFDPNEYSRFPDSYRKNISITEPYEPGSTFKVITLASLIENGQFFPGEIIDCGKGSLYKYHRRFSDHHPYDHMTASKVIEKSSNIGVIQLSERLSEESLYQTILDFGFKKKTEIDLPGEAVSNCVRHPSDWTMPSKAVISIGQEISVTPIQMLSAFAAIANEGIMVQPHVAKGHGDPENIFIPYEGHSKKLVISAKAARKITKILERVVLSGTGVQAQVEGYSVAGKTGTAQVFDNRRNEYYKDRFVASFIGYAPSDDPKIVCLVMIEIPKGKKFYGGDVAAPVFSKIVEQTLLYLKIPPNHRMFPTEQLNEPYYQKPNQAASPTFPRKKSSLVQDHKLLLAHSSPAGLSSQHGKKQAADYKADQMPDLMGKSLRDATSLISSKGCRIHASGSGYVIHQYPEPGMKLSDNDICILELSHDSNQLAQTVQKEDPSH